MGGGKCRKCKVNKWIRDKGGNEGGSGEISFFFCANKPSVLLCL